MKRRNRVCTLSGFLAPATVVALLLGGSSALAEDSTGRGADRAALREDLLYVVNAYRNIAAQQLDTGLKAALESAGRELELAADEELASAEMLAPIVKQMRQRIDELTALVHAQSPKANLSTASPGFPSADYPNVNSLEFVITILSSDLPGVINFLGAFLMPAVPQAVEAVVPFYCVGDPDGDGVANRKDNLFVLTSQNLLAGAEALKEAASRICEQDLTIIGEGGNLSVLCIVTDVLFVAAKTIHANMLLCEGAIDSAEIAGTYHRVGHLHDDLANVDSDIAALNTLVSSKMDAMTNKISVVQETLDTTVELRRIHLQVVELKEKVRFLLGTEEGGVPVDVTLIGVTASQGVVNHKPLTFIAVPAVGTPTGATGLLDVALELPGDLHNAKIFQFQVKDTHRDDEGNVSHEHFGTVIYHRTGPAKQSGRP
jgi:hypothetical protein